MVCPHVDTNKLIKNINWNVTLKCKQRANIINHDIGILLIKIYRHFDFEDF